MLPCKTVVLKNRKLHCRPILKTFHDNKQLHNKIICSVNSHILASNKSTSLHMDNACLKMIFKMSTTSLHTSRQMTTRLTNRCCDVTMMSSLGTALPSKQEKYLITHLLAWSIAMEHAKKADLRNAGPPEWRTQIAKNYEIRCKIIWNIRTKRVALFSGQCNLRFLSTKVLQGSVETCVNYGRIFIDISTANLLHSVTVKEFWKSVSISRSFRQK